ncbi:MAG TPA: CHAT domain-containing protein, partial [Nakamurella sp.]
MFARWGVVGVRVRVTESVAPEGQLLVGVSVERDGYAPTTVQVTTPFELDPVDVERFRWYLEDFLEWPLEPAPKLAEGVEQRLVQVGIELFGAVFGSGDARDLWAKVRDELPSARFEVVSEVTGPGAVPWELLRDPRTDTAVALRAGTFVRAQHNPAVQGRLPVAGDPVLRVLVVICRPAGSDDVPFRSVAAHLVELARQNEALDLDVLRPPTFQALARVLRAAQKAGRPYHVVHFDGHGAYLDTEDLKETPSNGGAPSSAGGGGGGGVSRWRYGLLSPPRPGSHGYLLFENPEDKDNQQLVDGPKLGALLAETGVPVLVLNACRSAHAEAPAEPQPDDAAAKDVHSRVRAYGSLAQEVVDAGVPGVVAMRYNVWVVTAAQFVAELYTALLNGAPLGEAVTAGRKNLADHPDRVIAFDPRPLQDWMVPVAYEATPLRLFTRPEQQITLKPINPTGGGGSEGNLVGVPDRPDAGFVGRDDTILAVDRAFDTHRVVLLHAYAGGGKTSTAAEFARWYTHTGGLTSSDGADGLVLFTSFEHHQPLPRVLDQLGNAFEPLLARNGIEWLTLDDPQRRDMALQLLTLTPVLWIWDNVEPIAGFPTGTASAWTPAEQHDLAQFLRDIHTSATTKARVLLTSRRDEHDWLGGLPVRIALPPMPLRERVQLAANIIAKYPPHKLTDVADWRPLLRYTAGNPLTLTILVGQVLRTGTTTRQGIETFLTQLKAGEVGIDDDQAQGRTASLGASLSYGLKEAFTDTDRARLAALHLFHDHVDVDALTMMGAITGDDGQPLVPELAGLTREQGIALLDRAAEIGILTARGGGYYTAHPALPWYFTQLFTATYGPPDTPRALAVTRAYTRAISNLGNYYFNRIEQGQRGWLGNLADEEANLLHALHLARTHHWWDRVMRAMQGLRALYGQAGRRAEWARLVHDLTGDLTDPATDLRLPGREDHWSVFTNYRIRIARDNRDWPQAEHLQTLELHRDRQNAATALTKPPDQLDDTDRNRIRNLGISLHDLADILREQGNPDCIPLYQDAIDLARRIGDRNLEVAMVFNLGHAYLDIPAV